jgi:hypothetical protein
MDRRPNLRHKMHKIYRDIELARERSTKGRKMCHLWEVRSMPRSESAPLFGSSDFSANNQKGIDDGTKDTRLDGVPACVYVEGRTGGHREIEVLTKA